MVYLNYLLRGILALDGGPVQGRPALEYPN